MAHADECGNQERQGCLNGGNGECGADVSGVQQGEGENHSRRKGEEGKRGLSPQEMITESLADLDKVFAPEIHGAHGEGEGRASSEWGKGAPMLDARELASMFLSHTPPHATPSSYGARTSKQCRVLGPRHNTLERQSAHTWGGRKVTGEDSAPQSAGEELSTSLSEMRLGLSPQNASSQQHANGHERRGGSSSAAAATSKGIALGRLRSCAQLEAAGVIDDKQKSAIKDLLILGDHDELHAALDEYVSSCDATLILKLVAAGTFDGIHSPRRSDSIASVGHEFDSLMDIEGCASLPRAQQRARGLSGVSLDSDEMESVANAAALAAAAVGESPAEISGSFFLSHSLSSRESSRGGASEAKQPSREAAAPASKGRRRSGNHAASWDFGDDVAFEMDLDGVLDDADVRDVFDDDDDDDDDENDGFVRGENPSEVAQARLIVRIGSDALSRTSTHGSEEEEEEEEDDGLDTRTTRRKPKASKKMPSSSSSSRRRTASGVSRQKSFSSSSSSKASPARRKKKDEEDDRKPSPSMRRKKVSEARVKTTTEAPSTPLKDEPDDGVDEGLRGGVLPSSAAQTPTSAAKDERKGDKGGDKARVMPATVEGAVSSTVTEIPALAELPDGAAPVYDALINYPRAKARGARHCVMCGRAPAPSEPGLKPEDSTDAKPDDATKPSPAAPEDATSEPPVARGGAVIPKQNKDVCRECDKATWKHTATNCYFKWCKGCKRFRNLVSFKGKLQASKCDNCRARGREGYMRRKDATGETGEAGEPAGDANPTAPKAEEPARTDDHHQMGGGGGVVEQQMDIAVESVAQPRLEGALASGGAAQVAAETQPQNGATLDVDMN